MCDSIENDLYAKALGRELLRWIEDCHPNLIAQQVCSDAIDVLSEIQTILNDDTLDDPDCFYRIDAIVRTFYHYGLSTHRHSELD